MRLSKQRYFVDHPWIVVSTKVTVTRPPRGVLNTSWHAFNELRNSCCKLNLSIVYRPTYGNTRGPVSCNDEVTFDKTNIQVRLLIMVNFNG